MRERAQGAVAAGLPPPRCAPPRARCSSDEGIHEAARRLPWTGWLHLPRSAANEGQLVALARASCGRRPGPRGWSCCSARPCRRLAPPRPARAGVMGAGGIAAGDAVAARAALVRPVAGRGRHACPQPARLEDSGRQPSPRCVVGILGLEMASGRCSLLLMVFAVRAHGPALLPIRVGTRPRPAEGGDHVGGHTGTALLLAHHLRCRPRLPAFGEPTKWRSASQGDVARDGQGRPGRWCRWQRHRLARGSAGPAHSATGRLHGAAELFAQTPGGQAVLATARRAGQRLDTVSPCRASRLDQASGAAPARVRRSWRRWRARPAATARCHSGRARGRPLLLAVRALAGPAPPDTLPCASSTSGRATLRPSST